MCGYRISCLCLGIRLTAFGEVGKQVVDELFLLFLAILPGAAGKIGDICACFHVFVQGHQGLVVLLQDHTKIDV